MSTVPIDSDRADEADKASNGINKVGKVVDKSSDDTSDDINNSVSHIDSMSIHNEVPSSTRLPSSTVFSQNSNDRVNRLTLQIPPELISKNKGPATDSPISASSMYHDLTPLPSPLISSDVDSIGLFKAYNGASPPTSAISRAPSIRRPNLHYPLDVLSSQRGSPIISTSSLQTAIMFPSAAPTSSDGSRSVSEYTPVPSGGSPRPHMTVHLKPAHTHVSQDAVLRVVKQRTAASSAPVAISETDQLAPLVDDSLGSPDSLPRPHTRASSSGSHVSVEHMHREKLLASPKKPQKSTISRFRQEVLADKEFDGYSSSEPSSSSTENVTSSTSTSITSPESVSSPDAPFTSVATAGDVQVKSPEARVYEAYDTEMHKSIWYEIRSLGRGAFSRVVLAHPAERHVKPEYRTTLQNYLVAIKIVEMGAAGGTSRERIESGLRREIDVLKTIQHPSLIKLFAFNIDKSRALMVLPYCAGGDLFDLASGYRDRLEPRLVRRIFAEVVFAVAYLHKNNIVHRDIKLENVLLNMPVDELLSLTDVNKYPRALATLTDLGLSKRIDPDNPTLTTRCGSEDYVPPELLMGQPYDGRQTDSWALGVLLYAIMEGRLPFDPPLNAGGGRARGRTAHRIARVEWSWILLKNDENLNWDDSEWGGGKKIVEMCLQKRDKRLLASDMVNLPWIKDAFPALIQPAVGIDIKELFV